MNAEKLECLNEELPQLSKKEKEILREYTHVCLTIKKLSGDLLSSHNDLGFRAVRDIKYSIVQLVKRRSKLAARFYKSACQDIKNYV